MSPDLSSAAPPPPVSGAVRVWGHRVSIRAGTRQMTGKKVHGTMHHVKCANQAEHDDNPFKSVHGCMGHKQESVNHMLKVESWQAVIKRMCVVILLSCLTGSSLFTVRRARCTADASVAALEKPRALCTSPCYPVRVGAPPSPCGQGRFHRHAINHLPACRCHIVALRHLQARVSSPGPRMPRAASDLRHRSARCRGCREALRRNEANASSRDNAQPGGALETRVQGDGENRTACRFGMWPTILPQGPE